MVTEAATTETATAQCGMIFELEGAVVDGRAKLFEAAKSVFQKAGIQLGQSQFARLCTHGSSASIIDKLIDEAGNDKLSEDAAETIMADYTLRLQKQATLHPLFLEVLKEAKKRGVAIAAISILPEEAAQTVLTKSGIAAHGVELHAFEQSERHFPRVDCWMKVCRQIVKNPRSCIAIAGSRDSGRSALSSGMRCVVLPDNFTSYQDFSGADIVLENPEDYTVAGVFDSLT